MIKLYLFFEEYKIQGVKSLDFNDFKEVSFLMKSKLHLSKEGLEKILLIKSGMNLKEVVYNLYILRIIFEFSIFYMFYIYIYKLENIKIFNCFDVMGFLIALD